MRFTGSSNAALASVAIAACVACGCGSRTSLAWDTATVGVTSGSRDAAPENDAESVGDGGSLGPEGGVAPHDGGHAPREGGATPHDGGLASSEGGEASSPPCNEPPWVLFELDNSGRDQGPLAYRIYARHPDGTGGHVVALPHSGVQYPSVAPDGASIVYAASQQNALYVYRFGAASDVRVASAGRTPLGASLSRDGTRIAYSDSINIWLVPADGSGVANVAIPGSQTLQVSSPVFTADGQSVVYGGYEAVTSANLDGASYKTLVSCDSYDTAQVGFSPDYESLAAVLDCGENDFGLYTYPSSSFDVPCETGTLLAQISTDGALTQPAWGPTGLIAYSDGYDVFLVPAKGGTPTNLTSDLADEGNATEPTWAPACTNL